MRRNLFLVMCSICFLILLISNSANAMYLSTDPVASSVLTGEAGDSFDIVVTMHHDTGDTGLLKSFQLRLEWGTTSTGYIIDNVSFTNELGTGTFTDAVVDNPWTYDVSWDFGSGITTPDTVLGRFSFLGSTPGVNKELDIHSSGFSGFTPIVSGTGIDTSILFPITITAGGTEPNPTVPEPATMILLGLGLIGLVGIRRKIN